MWSGILLLIYATGVSTGGAIVLRRARWTDHSPLMAVVAWQILGLATLGSIGLAGLLMLSPTWGSATLSSLFWALEMIGHGHLAEALPVLWCWFFIALAVTVFTRTATVTAAAFVRARRLQRSHLASLRAVAEPHDSIDHALVLSSDAAVVYCVPGRRPTMVFSTAALHRLSREEISAVIAHELAHIRGRHDLVLAVAIGLRRGFGFLPVFRWGRDEQARLLEMIADDHAARTNPRLTVASAMLTLARSRTPVAGLGAGGHSAGDRVERLIASGARLSVRRRISLAILLVATAFLPLGITLLPHPVATQISACGPGGPA